MHLNHDQVNQEIKKYEHVLYGPFVGEFGWELMSCQGYLRKLREDNPHIKSFNVISRTGRDFLYEDFIDSYIEYDCPGNGMTGALCMDYVYDNFHLKAAEFLGLDKYIWIPTQTLLVDYHAHGPGREQRLPKFLNSQKFIKYESDKIKNSPYDLLIHARDSHHHDTAGKNWPHYKWDYLVENLSKDYNIAAIGSKNGSYVPAGCTDLRDTPLEETVSYFNQTKGLITSCSGPAHLASLCATPLIVMTVEQNRNRYASDWNPHKSDRCVIIDSWDPDEKMVLQRTTEFLNR